MSGIARLRIPEGIRAGEAFEVRLLVQHDMETGYRRDMQGKAVPLNVINDLRVTLDGREVFRAELGSGISANPYLSFWLRAEKSGTLQIDWVDTLGVRGSTRGDVVVA